MGFAGRDGTDEHWTNNPRELPIQVVHTGKEDIILDHLLDRLIDHNTRMALRYGPLSVLNLVWNSRPGGSWDIKRWPGIPGRTFSYRGQELSYDDLGNIHYGAVGAGIGQTPTVIRAGAGIASIAAGIYDQATSDFRLEYLNRRDWGDSPKDARMVMYGYDLRLERAHPFYAWHPYRKLYDKLWPLD